MSPQSFFYALPFWLDDAQNTLNEWKISFSGSFSSVAAEAETRGEHWGGGALPPTLNFYIFIFSKKYLLPPHKN